MDFNIPNDTFVNSGSSSGAIADVTTIIGGAGAGSPAKYRGLWFDGSNNGLVDVSALILNHSFAVHSWVLQASADAMTIYSRDRDDFATATSHQHLKLSIGGAGNDKMVVDIAQDIDSANYMQAVSTATISLNTWTYLVYSL